MGTIRITLAVILLSCACLPGTIASTVRDLGFEERVEAQEAIERVYYSHQIDATKPFEQAVPRDVLEHKVRTYLAQSLALEAIWNTPMTARMLRQELERSASGTRMPERLRELFAALDDDPFLVQETLIRATLVDRLARRSFVSDARIHSEALSAAQAVRGELTRGGLDPHDEHPSRSVEELTRQPGDLLDAAQSDRRRGLAPERIGAIGPVRDERETSTVRVVLEEDTDRTVVATYAFPKQTWDSWWPGAADDLDVAIVLAVADGSLPLPPALGSGDRFCTGDSWEADSGLDAHPGRRTGHTAVWTGSEMLVWGGFGDSFPQLDTGLRYDPATDSWTEMSSVDTPSGRSGHAAVWTGELMVVWGATGGFFGPSTDTGGRYDPATDTWTPTSTTDAPVGRGQPTGVWTGDVVVFWGGYSSETPEFCNCCSGGNGVGCDDPTCEDIVCAVDSFCCIVLWDEVCDAEAESLCTCCGDPAPVAGPVNSGGRYDPDTDTWLATSQTGAPPGRSNHTAVWTGDRMIVWGGFAGTLTDTGGVYDPVANTWVSTPTAGAPVARDDHTAVWTGSEMVVWGGVGDGSYQETGGRYDPSSGVWTPTSTADAPPGRTDHTAVWTGSEMIVWGGLPTSQAARTGGRYDPAKDSWTPTPIPGAPSPRFSHSMVWTGQEAIVWGGNPNYLNGYYEVLDTGARYDPATNSWAPTFTNNAPQARGFHTAVWTGNEMIVWAGATNTAKTLQVTPTGGRYDPALDGWTPTPTTGAPEARYQHTAVWTGEEMIVWGGHNDFNFYLDSGGRYDPIGDLWAPTSMTDAPPPRYDHVAVWSGSHMIVWGGVGPGGSQDTGGRYDPVTDSWTATTLVDAPPGSELPTAIWAGGRIIVWGGYGAGSGQNTGGLYDPIDDVWTATTTEGAPSPRFNHTAVRAGAEMVVWGGLGGASTGGRYDIAEDAWTPTATDGAPIGSNGHSAVWTGNRMVVWGGAADGSGGVYDPVTDSWTSTTQDGAPPGRSDHTAVWTGESMIVWGGGWQPLATGGSYDPDGEDLDGDTVGCGFDCDDEDPGVFAAPVEIGSVQLGPDKQTLRWPAQSRSAGSTTTYDIVRGSPSELPVGSGGTEVCLASGHAPPGIGSDFVELDDPAVPPSGEAFWYLVRATNACGIGTYGSTSAGVERQTSACP